MINMCLPCVIIIIPKVSKHPLCGVGVSGVKCGDKDGYLNRIDASTDVRPALQAVRLLPWPGPAARPPREAAHNDHSHTVSM